MGNIYEEAPAGGKWLDFSANINPLGLAPEVKQVIAENIEGIIHYPDPKARKLKAALSGHYRIPEDQLLLGNGSLPVDFLLHMMLQRLEFKRSFDAA